MENNNINFWGSNKYFYDDFEFDEKKSLHYLMNIEFSESDKVKFISDAINYFLTAENIIIYLKQFDKSVNLIENLFNLEKKQIYFFMLEHISDFKKKEDFKIFEYFKDLNEFKEGYNNFTVELLNWLSYNDETINKLLNEDKKVVDIFGMKGWTTTKYTQISGVSGKGKSIFTKSKILKNNVIVISDKECNLQELKEDDKDFFYELLISLTKENFLNNFLLNANQKAKHKQLKGIALYIEKKFYNNYLEDKLINNGNYCKGKVKKI